MRIVIISPSYPPAATGEAQHCLQLATRLAARGHDVQVLTNQQPEAVQPDSFGLHALVRGWRWRDVPALRRLLIGLQPDAVLLIYTAWLYDDHPMVTFIATALRKWRSGVRVLTLVELAIPAPPGTLAVRLGRKLARYWAGKDGVDFGFGTLLRDSSAVAVLGPSILAELEARGSPELAARALVVPPPPLVRLPLDTTPAARTQARTRLGVASDTVVLAYFGFVYPGKGVETLLAALQRLLADGRQLHLLMAGGGRGLPGGDPKQQAFEVSMQGLAHALGVADRVSWLPGEPSESDAMGRDLLACDVAVLPFDDGAELRRSSIAVVTSLGLPLVSTQPRASEPAFLHGENVHLCPAGDPSALATALAQVADDPDYRARLAAGGRRLAQRWFSWETATDQILMALHHNSMKNHG